MKMYIIYKDSSVENDGNNIKESLKKVLKEIEEKGLFVVEFEIKVA